MTAQLLRMSWPSAIILLVWLLGAIYSLYAWQTGKYRTARFDFFAMCVLCILKITNTTLHNVGLSHQWTSFVGASYTITTLCVFVLLVWNSRKKTWLQLSNYELRYEYARVAKSIWQEAGSSPVPEEEVDDALNTAAWIYFALRRRDPSDRLLEPLLRDKDERVRVLAARNLLWSKTQESLKVLDELSNRNDGVGQWAKSFVTQWSAGEIKPVTDPPEQSWGQTSSEKGLLQKLADRIAAEWKSFWRDNTEPEAEIPFIDQFKNTAALEGRVLLSRSDSAPANWLTVRIGQNTGLSAGTNELAERRSVPLAFVLLPFRPAEPPPHAPAPSAGAALTEQRFDIVPTVWHG